MPSALATDLVELADQLRRITVALRTTEGASGSGVIWRSDGLIVTSAHVVAGASRALNVRAPSSAPTERGAGAHVVLADGRSLAAALVALEPQLDLALLRVE